ncbi:sugar phosphate nucleotidyltransferase [Humisphaera borealis]|uniref:Glucose-1-phosphate cytidylyltransferase n=1 Tax=Humisphaera borealis TaxID=2807512 RepID=A0A7M2X0J0_9BACT|nr:sugar phosphate nucleotidyltransferase [Humisphaera borealis]QOV91278.1 glucose-1-phosphate cytidylyltransferase [Humisphaera borealis]
MKVVLFCGGQGLRLREFSDSIPKPMVPIGYRPVMWHLMKYYAHYGHKDFILCLGHKADYIKKYFLEYEESLSNDFVLSKGGRELKMLATDIDSWNITFVDTGVQSNIGQRLMAVKEHLKGEEMFLANYSDNLTDAPLPDMIDHLKSQGAVASFLSNLPSQSFHIVKSNEAGTVNEILPVRDSGIWLNGGFFVLKQEIFDYINPGDELVIEPFNRLIEKKLLTTYKYPGFWACMDTFKEKQVLEDVWTKGHAPWEVWKNPRHVTTARAG